jgi:hypothetical protein
MIPTAYGKFSRSILSMYVVFGTPMIFVPVHYKVKLDVENCYSLVKTKYDIWLCHHIFFEIYIIFLLDILFLLDIYHYPFKWNLNQNAQWEFLFNIFRFQETCMIIKCFLLIMTGISTRFWYIENMLGGLVGIREWGHKI